MENGAFHPKVWALRFDPMARPEHRERQAHLSVAHSEQERDGFWMLGTWRRFEGAARRQRRNGRHRRLRSSAVESGGFTRPAEGTLEVDR